MACPGAGQLPGQSLSHYEIVGRLGSGAMGTVYRARSLRTGEFVAIKTVALPRPEHLPRIRREIQALARLRHPGIVRILDSSTAGGRPWYAMELIEGTPLREHDLKRGASPSEALRSLAGIARRLCVSLAYLHGEGLVHLDLKPDNVLVRPGGEPVLVDFGVASAFSGATNREALEVELEAAGTLLYMSPEQLQGELVDARADLYALGCILYELLTGQPPFLASSALGLIQAHLYQPPPRPSDCIPGLPHELDELVVRLLAKDARQRFGYADDVAAVLGSLGAEGGFSATAPPPRSYLYRPGFSGREEALGVLDEHLERLAGGAGGLVLIAGENGVGKTRLALELSRKALRRVQVLTGECLPTSASAGQRKASSGTVPGSPLAPGSSPLDLAPLQPLRGALQVLADRCRAGGRAETQRLLGQRGKLLALYEPALADLPGQEGDPEPAKLPPAAARSRLWSSVAETLAALAAERPVLLVLDDLQWADELTLGLLEFLLRTGELERTRLLIVGTYRLEELGDGLRRVLDAPGVARLRLERLDERAVGTMVGDMLALAAPPPVFVRYLARHSEGNPFFVAEYLRMTVGEGVLHRDEAGRWQFAAGAQLTGASDRAWQEATGRLEALPLPGSIRELARWRLEGLGLAARHLVQVASVLGRELDAALLVDVAGTAEAQSLEALQELLARQVLEELEAGRLRFAHDKLREVAYELIAPERRRKLHRAAAEAIETRFAARREMHLAALGHHWEQAGEADMATPCYLAAARRARDRYAHDEAQRLYRVYLRLMDQPTAESIRARCELAEELLESRGPQEALPDGSRSLDEARALGVRPIEGLCLDRLGLFHHMMGRMGEARELYSQALAVHREVGDRQREAIVLSKLGALEFDRGHLQASEIVLEQALAILGEIADRHSEVDALGNLALVYKQQGRRDEAVLLLEQVLAVDREIGNKRREAITLHNLASIHNVHGRFEEARSLAERALKLHREVGDRRGEGMILSTLGDTSCDQGRLDEARVLFEQSLAIHRELGNRPAEAIALRILADIHRGQGRVPEARTLYEQALDLTRNCAAPHSEGLTLLGMAVLERQARGELAAAERLVEQAEAILGKHGSPNSQAMCLCERSHIGLGQGLRDRGFLDEAGALAVKGHAGPGSELARALTRLRRAHEASDAGELLFRGECLEDLPEGLRRWLVATGQLPLDGAPAARQRSVLSW